MEPYLYSAETLPKGFMFPQSYVDLAKAGALPDLAPWWFLCTSQKDADGWLLAVKRLYPTRKLVPFALWAGSDDIACFDAEVASTNPKVYYVHCYASPGWEDRGHVSSFDEWLTAEKANVADLDNS